jgi:hypothetical protein
LEEKKGRREDAGCADFDDEETPASVGDLEKRTWREDAGRSYLQHREMDEVHRQEQRQQPGQGPGEGVRMQASPKLTVKKCRLHKNIILLDKTNIHKNSGRRRNSNIQFSTKESIRMERILGHTPWRESLVEESPAA